MWCNDCMVEMEPAFCAQEGMQLRGWVCPKCTKLEEAIGREKLFTPETLAAESETTTFDPDNMPAEWHERTKRDTEDFVYSLSPVA